MRIVVVEWWDAVSVLDMEDKSLKPMLARTVGFVYEEAPDYITVVAEWFEEDGQVRGVTTVPRCSVAAIREVQA